MMSIAVATAERRSPGKSKRLMPSPLQLPSDLLAYNREISGPATVISAAVGDLRSTSSTSQILGPQYTHASSVYSQPVPLPSGIHVAEASMPRWAYRIQSQSTVFEEDELSVLDGETDEYEPLSAEGRGQNGWQNTFDSTISTPRRSKGWWNFVTSPFTTPAITNCAPSPRSAPGDGDRMRKVAILALQAANSGSEPCAASQPGRFCPATASCSSPEELFIHGDACRSPASSARATAAPLKPGSASRQPTAPNKYDESAVSDNQRLYLPRTPKSHLKPRAVSGSTLVEDDKAFSPYSGVNGGTPIVAMASLGTVQRAHDIVKVLHSGVALAPGPSTSVPDRIQPDVVPRPSLCQFVDLQAPQEPRLHVAEVRRNSLDRPTQDAVGSLFPPYTFHSADDCEQAYEWSRSVTPVRSQEKHHSKLKFGCGWRTYSSKTWFNPERYRERLFWIIGLAIGSGLILLVVLLAMFISQQ